MVSSALVRDPEWIRRDLLSVLNFYYPTCIDTTHGGYVAQLSDEDGTVYDARRKGLVSTARFVFDFCTGARVGGPEWCVPAAEHGLTFLRNVAYNEDTGGYAWSFDGREIDDPRHATYGHAFALFAFGSAVDAGIGDAEDDLSAAANVLDEHFWEPDHGAYRSDLDADWEPIEDYRGQNANMHACEALLAAYEATGEDHYVERAATVAETVAKRLPDAGDGLLWEHFTEEWDHDWTYNIGEKDDLFRPWGYQPGHLLEWAKLLVELDAHHGADWYVDRAVRFFDAAVENGWDDEYGGLVYTFDRDGEFVVTDKYFWPLAEGLGAAALLGEATGEERFWEWYDRMWEYLLTTMTNEKYGTWYATVTREGELTKLDPTPKVKSGYHHVNADYAALRALKAL